MSKQKEYRALVGMDFKNSDDEEIRVEAGDKIEGMPENEIKHQINLKHAEVWKERQTENVVKPGEHSEVYGVIANKREGTENMHFDQRIEEGDEE